MKIGDVCEEKLMIELSQLKEGIKFLYYKIEYYKEKIECKSKKRVSHL